MPLDVCSDVDLDCVHESGAILECGGVLGDVVSDVHCKKCGSYIGFRAEHMKANWTQWAVGGGRQAGGA